MSNTALVPTRRHLARREVLRVPHSAGTLVECQSGSVWITEENDSRDQVLEPGDAARLERPGTALVYALEPSTVVLERHAAPRSASEPVVPGFAELLVARWTSPLRAFALWS